MWLWVVGWLRPVQHLSNHWKQNTKEIALQQSLLPTLPYLPSHPSLCPFPLSSICLPLIKRIVFSCYARFRFSTNRNFYTRQNHTHTSSLSSLPSLLSIASYNFLFTNKTFISLINKKIKTISKSLQYTFCYYII